MARSFFLYTPGGPRLIEPDLVKDVQRLDDRGPDALTAQATITLVGDDGDEELTGACRADLLTRLIEAVEFRRREGGHGPVM